MANDPNVVDDVKAKTNDFVAKAKAGNLDEATLKWGLSAGAIVSGISLLFNYMSASAFGVSFAVSGLDLLRLDGGFSLRSIEALSIPLSALFALYLHFGEPSMKLLKLETPGRAKLVYLIGMIAAGIGVIGCLDCMRHSICLGNLLGFVGLGVLTFVYFKLWQMSPAAAPATATPAQTPPAQTPPSSTPPSNP